MIRNSATRWFAVLAIAAAACSGDDGKTGPQGPAGPAGPGAGEARRLSLVIDKVETPTVDGAPKSTVTFTIFPSSAVCPGGTCDANLAGLGQKSFSASEYDPATRTFTTAKTFSYGDYAFVGTRTDAQLGTGAQYTASKAGASFAPEASQHAMIYGYVTDKAVAPAPTTGHYLLPDNVASASKVFGTIDYTSAANVSGCEKCHGAPYAKHGYRLAHVEGLPDFASCKACHTGQRVGGHQDWQKIVDDPAGYKASGVTADEKTKYAYTANVMNDTHMSHAMEFNFPQSMSNCVTCHEGKLDTVLADANFKIETCKSCHPVNGKGGTDDKRAPALLGDGTDASPGVMPTAIHGNMDLATTNCSTCHQAGTFKRIHSGRVASIYADDGSKFADAITTTIDSATFDPSTNRLTVNASMSGLAANALVQPTVVVSLYGYGTKDFIVSGHGSHADGARNLEWTEGATRNSARLTLDPATATAGTTAWTATADLSTWAGMIGAGRQVQRAEIAFLPAVGRDQTALVSDTNPEISVSGKTATIDLVGGALVEDKDAYGKAIVDPAKCNVCHDRLGTTFHAPHYGSAGVVACRTCHVVGAAGSHLEMQSRSIDSYVHAIHSMQAFDPGDIEQIVDPTEREIAELRHELHVEGNYPNFAGPLNCESCHSAGAYEVPDQTKSLPSLLSASDPVSGRNIQSVPSYVVGPAARACGSCHRSQAINEDDAGKLAAFYQHTRMFGTMVTGTAANLDTVTKDIMARIGAGPAFTGTALEGTQVESCTICHSGAGANHQATFNRWKDGL